MTLLEMLKMGAAVVTVVTGLVSFVRPRSVQGFTGLATTSVRGVTEIRAVLGGAFIALGAIPLVTGAPETYRMLGLVYLVIGATRVVGMFVDGSFERSNLISLAVEIVFGVILVP